MFFNEVIDNGNTEGLLNTFMGYNHNPIISDGEFYDMENMTSDNFPLLSPRKKRESVLNISNDEYDSIELTHETSYESDVFETSLKYTFDAADVDGELGLVLSFNILDVFSSLSMTLYFLDENEKVQQETVIDIDDLNFNYSFQPLYPKISFELNGIFEDPEQFEPANIETYISSWSLAQQNPRIRGMLVKDDKLAYFIEDTLYYDNQAYDFEDYIDDEDDKNSSIQMLSMGAYIYMFPINVYINTQDTSEMGSLGAKVEETGTINYSLCRIDGTGYNATVSATEPQTKNNGDYWLDTANVGLYMWSDYNKSWNAIATTYIAIQFPNIDPNDYFKEGDAIYLNSQYEDINNGSIIQHVGDDFIVVIGVMSTSTATESFTEESPFIVERKVPILDYTCVSGNRIWGCRKGLNESGENVNEIYASKLGDPKNWYAYAGISSDSYAVSIGDDGDFTGAVSYQGLPTFFKETKIYKIYGSYPAQYTLYSYDQRGVQKGSERSLAVCGDYLIYKSLVDVCIYDGSVPTTISKALGKTKYEDAVAGSSMNKYYLSVVDTENNSHLFVYDLNYNMWHREDDLRIIDFAYDNFGKLYGLSKLKMYSFGTTGDDFNLTKEAAENHVDWYVVTGLIGLTFPAHKYINEITLRAKIDYGSMLRVLISYDDSDYEELKIIEGHGTLESYNFPLMSPRADHYRLKLEGRNDVYVYSIATQLEEGSEEDGI